MAGLALWQGIDSALRLYGGTDIDLSREEGPAARTVLERDAAYLEMIDDWLGDPQARIRAGLLQFRLSLSTGPDIVLERRRALAKAIDDLRDGLARAPADARAWTALAHALLATGELEKGKLAFRTALLTAFYEPTLTLWRCQLGLGLWPLLDDADRRLVANQVRWAWTSQPADLVGLAKIANHAVVIAAVLDQDPAEKKAFEKALRR
ncbi:hypothetical protein CWS72_11430 [Telmatospirillum siberiense]|uniref:Uncharacterized protein n=2 Tax=Telmatospirillum siberiense TaxID=382514 RepID=A0A2N3PVL8_9PROT|nr:hypothetical protein CWS72_11430 [Telmatospirillum siberiense]